MKKSAMNFLLVAALLSGLLSACSGNTDNAGGSAPPPSAPASPSAEARPGSSPSASPDASESAEPSEKPEPGATSSPATGDLVAAMLKSVEQPALIDLNADDVRSLYGIDPEILAEFTVKAPLMNVKTNEIAVFKVKKTEDVAAVKKGMEKRAADVRQTFENYLQDQYENAKNYKIVAQGDYVLFLISESADDLEKAFKAEFGQK